MGHSLTSSQTNCLNLQVSIVFCLFGQIQFSYDVEVIVQQLSNWFFCQTLVFVTLDEIFALTVLTGTRVDPDIDPISHPPLHLKVVKMEDK
jgi:glycerol uptake facilitator-like aquaporin